MSSQSPSLLFIPLLNVPEVRLAERLTAEQKASIASSLAKLEVKKRNLVIINEEIEHISRFKWNRVRSTFHQIIYSASSKHRHVDSATTDAGAIVEKCARIPVKFFSPFEEFVMSPLEKALAPLHFQLVGQVYTGANATLFKCVDLNSGNFVAAKQFYTRQHRRLLSPGRRHPESATSSSSSSESFTAASGLSESEDESDEIVLDHIPLKEALKESEMLKICKGHPNIVQFVNSSYELPYFFIFTEFYEGGTISSNKIIAGRDPKCVESELVWRARFGVLRQIKEGLAYIHEMGVVHGDIKPANIILDSLGMVRIADFGNSELVTSNFDRSVPLCVETGPHPLSNFTIPYMAPEVLKTGTLSWASDIWAFGCLVLEIVTGVRPWDGLDAHQILIKLNGRDNPMDHAAELLNGVPDVFIQLLQCSLKTDPAHRLSARDLLEMHYK